MVARRPYWKGTLKLFLVTCPIALYPASSQSEQIHFHQINRSTGNRLRQRLVDEVTGDEVDRSEKGRGYEIAKGRYVEIDPEDLEAIELESTHTIDIEKFVPDAEIDKRYYEKPYYIVPDGKSGEDAFAVLRDAMKNKGRVALARVVFANREHIVAIEPWDKGMLCMTLRYDDEVRPESEVFGDLPSPRVSKEMIDLASHILDSKAGKFDPSAFKDEYELALRQLVERKASGKVIQRAEPREERSNVIDLMAALRQSLKGQSLKGAGDTKRTKVAAARSARAPSKTSRMSTKATLSKSKRSSRPKRRHRAS
jgi:Ku protein